METRAASSSRSPRAKRYIRRRSARQQSKFQRIETQACRMHVQTESGGTSPLCTKPASVNLIDTQRKRVQVNYTVVQCALRESCGVELVPLESITQLCRTCYNKLIGNVKKGKWLEVLLEVAGHPRTITCSVHGRPVDECQGGRDSNSIHYMMNRGDPIAVAEQQRVIKVLYELDVGAILIQITIQRIAFFVHPSLIGWSR